MTNFEIILVNDFSNDNKNKEALYSRSIAALISKGE